MKLNSFILTVKALLQIPIMSCYDVFQGQKTQKTLRFSHGTECLRLAAESPSAAFCQWEKFSTKRFWRATVMLIWTRPRSVIRYMPWLSSWTDHQSQVALMSFVRATQVTTGLVLILAVSIICVVQNFVVLELWICPVNKCLADSSFYACLDSDPPGDRDLQCETRNLQSVECHWTVGNTHLLHKGQTSYHLGRYDQTKPKRKCHTVACLYIFGLFLVTDMLKRIILFYFLRSIWVFFLNQNSGLRMDGLMKHLCVLPVAANVAWRLWPVAETIEVHTFFFKHVVFSHNWCWLKWHHLRTFVHKTPSGGFFHFFHIQVLVPPIIWKQTLNCSSSTLTPNPKSLNI